MRRELGVDTGLRIRLVAISGNCFVLFDERWICPSQISDQRGIGVFSEALTASLGGCCAAIDLRRRMCSELANCNDMHAQSRRGTWAFLAQGHQDIAI